MSGAPVALVDFHTGILDDVETAEKEAQDGIIRIRFGWMGDLDTSKDDEEKEEEEEKDEDEDEVKITLAAPQLPHTHKRHDCLTHVFGASPNHRACPGCYCAVCDVPVSECLRWDEFVLCRNLAVCRSSRCRHCRVDGVEVDATFRTRAV